MNRRDKVRKREERKTIIKRQLLPAPYHCTQSQGKNRKYT